MHRLYQTVTLLILLALTAVTALAQEAEEVVVPPKGLGTGMILIGLVVLAVVGVFMARREASGDENDLV